jgi:hypothetical protein
VLRANFQTPIRFPAMGLILGWDAETEHLSEWAWCQDVIGGIYFTNKLRSETLQRGLEFENVA